MFENVIKTMDSFLEQGLPGYDCIVFYDGKEIFRHWNGYSDKENQIAMSGKERINIYSCSKVITCTAALQLWEKGVFSLEDKLSDYLPEFTNMMIKTEGGLKKTDKPILIKHLFEMTAGFSYNVSSPQILKCYEDTNGKCPTRELVRYLAKEPLLFEPGDRWEYSLCHDVLAALVEVVSGTRFSEYVKEHIFDVLGMNSSTYCLPECEINEIAEQYRYETTSKEVKNVGKHILYYKLGSEYESGGAGCISTLEDYILFLEALREGEKLLKRSTVELMSTNRLTEHQLLTFDEKDGYGYGLGVRCKKENNSVTDFGWGGAAGAYLVVDIPNKISVFYAQHMHGSQYDRSVIYAEVLKTINNYL